MSIEEEVARLNKEVARLNKTVQIVTGACEQEEEKNKQLQRRITELEERESTIAAKLEEEKERWQSQIAKLEDERKKMDKLQTQIAIYRRYYDQLRGMIPCPSEDDDEEVVEGGLSVGQSGTSASPSSRNAVQDSLPIFDGEQAFCVTEWIDRMDAVMSTLNDEHRKNWMDLAVLALRGPALQWYETSWRSEKQAPIGWHGFCEDLSAHFGNKGAETFQTPVSSPRSQENDLDRDGEWAPSSEDELTEMETDSSFAQMRRSGRTIAGKSGQSDSADRRARQETERREANLRRTPVQKARLEEVIAFERVSDVKEKRSESVLFTALSSFDEQIKRLEQAHCENGSTKQGINQMPSALPYELKKRGGRVEKSEVLSTRVSEGSERFQSVQALDAIMNASEPLCIAVQTLLKQLGRLKSYRGFSRSLLSRFGSLTFSTEEEISHMAELHGELSRKGKDCGKKSTLTKQQEGERAGRSVNPADSVKRHKTVNRAPTTFVSIVNLAIFVVEQVLLYETYPTHLIKVPPSLVKDIRRLFLSEKEARWSWEPVLYPVQIRPYSFTKAFGNFAQSSRHYRQCERMGTQVVWLVRDIILQAVLPRWYITYGTTAICTPTNVVDLAEESKYSTLLSETYTNLAERSETSRRLLMNSKSLNCAYRPFIRTSSTFFCPENGPGGPGTHVGKYRIKDAESEDDMCFVQTRLYAWIRLYTQYIWFKNGLFDLSLVDRFFVYAVEVASLPDSMTCFRGKIEMQNKTWRGNFTPLFYHSNEQEGAQEAFLQRVRRMATEEGIDLCFSDRIRAIFAAATKEKSKGEGKEDLTMMKRGMQGEQEVCRKRSRLTTESIDSGAKKTCIDLTTNDN